MIKKTKFSTPAGFEPAREFPTHLAGVRLNRSATVSTKYDVIYLY